MSKKITRITDMGTVMQAIFADDASVIRVSESGLDLTILGALGSPVRVGQNTPVMVFNSSGSVTYVAFGAQTMAAPTGPTNGIPIPAGATMMLNTGTQSWICASASTVYGYAADQQ